MRRLLIAIMLVLSALLVGSGIGAAASAPIEVKPSGVTVIGRDAMAAKGTPDAGISYVADQLGR